MKNHAAGGASETPPPRGILALLFDRTYGPFVVARILSSSGTWIQNIAAAVLMFDLTGSAVWVGLVSMLQFLPPMTLSVFAGALTDRFNRRKILLAGRLLAGVAVGTLGVLVLRRGIEGFGGPYVLLVTVFIMGIGFAASGPAMHALIPSLVPPQDLDKALALSSSAPGVARTAGPAVGALLLVIGGPGLAFVTAAGCHIVFATVLVFVRARSHEREKGRPEILGGLKYLWEDRKAGALMLGVALLGFGADPVITLTPSFAAAAGAGAEVVGVLAAAFGIGAFVAIPVFSLMRRTLSLRTTGPIGFWMLGGGLLIVTASMSVPMGVVGFFIGGIGLILGQVSLTTRIQRRVPERLRGRVMALWTLSWLGSRPVAAMMNGIVAEYVSLRLAFLLSASVVIAASMFARVSYNEDTVGE